MTNIVHYFADVIARSIADNGSMKRTIFFKRLLALGFIIGIGLLAYTKVDIVLATAGKGLPNNIFQPIEKTTIITDRNGEPLYYLYKDQNRIMVQADQIAQTAKDAIIAAEDERFYQHHGVDVISIIRAIEANLQEKSIVSGGSTLTMQLVKNITGDDSRDWKRKAREAYEATVLEQRYSKDDILAAYFNVVPLGNNIVGIETASRLYFHKSAKDLTLPEAATLAALPSSPQYYYDNPDALKKRRNYVLSRMVQTGKINEAEAASAMAANTPLSEPVVPLKAPHFVMTVIDRLKNQYGDSLYTRGLTVRTTLDLHAQEKAEVAIKNNVGVLANVRAESVGMVALDPKTGDVLAMVGSTDYFNKNKNGEVNLATAPLSYGSTLKPLEYSFLMEKDHWSPGAIMWDVKTNFPIQGEAKPYSPNNYDSKFFGPMTLRDALANSRNQTAVKALLMVGLDTTLHRLQDFGITSLGTDTSQYGPSLVLGSGGIPLVQMAGAYTAFANGGQVNPAQYTLEIKDYRGKILQTRRPTNKLVIKPEVAFEIADILQDNRARTRVFGPNSPLVIPGHTVAAKTGTAENYTSALTLGFTPDIVTGVIVANNNNQPLVFGGSGAMAAAPFFHSFMSSYLADKPNVWFQRPSSIQEAEFPTVIGKVHDLVAPWQTPTDRFNKRVAETDDPLWNSAIAKSSDEDKKKEEAKAVAAATESTSGTSANESPTKEKRGRAKRE